MDDLAPAAPVPPLLVPLPVPPLVTEAYALARQVGFPLTREEAQPTSPSASLPGVGRFLAMLAAGCHGGRIGEIGTGVGIGTAWMAGAMPADCTLVTVEIDARRAAASAQLLASDRRVRVLKGDARELLPPCGPFDLLFADGGWRDPAGLSGLVDLLRVGGQIVMDDVTPLLALPADPLAVPIDPLALPIDPPALPIDPLALPIDPLALPIDPLALPADPPLPEKDVKRAFFFGDPRLLSTEVVLPDLCNSLLVGTRLT